MVQPVRVVRRVLIGVGLVLGLVGCGDDLRGDGPGVVREATIDVFEVRAGDCVHDPDRGGVVTRVTVVPCDRPHTAEAFLRYAVSVDEYDQGAIHAEMGAACRDAFEGYVDVPLALSELDVYYHVPDFNTFAGGGRIAVCYVWDARVLAADDELTESLRGAER